MKTAFITALLAITALFCLGLSSCATEYAVATPGFYSPSSPVDPAAEFGVFIKRGEKLTPAPEIIAQK